MRPAAPSRLLTRAVYFLGAPPPWAAGVLLTAECGPVGVAGPQSAWLPPAWVAAASPCRQVQVTGCGIPAGRGVLVLVLAR